VAAERSRAWEAGEGLISRLLTMVEAGVPGTLGAGIALAENGRLRALGAVGVAIELDAAQWVLGEGPGWTVLQEGRPISLPTDPGGAVFDPARWPALAQTLEEGAEAKAAAGVRGLVVMNGEEDAQLGLVVTVYLDHEAEQADVERVERMQPVVTSAASIVEYCSGEEQRAEQMVQMVQYRRVIEQAKGLVMAITSSDAGAAFATLTRASQHFNVRLRNLAVALVELVGGGPAEGPSDPAAVVTPSERDRAAAERVWAALRTSGPGGGPEASPGGGP
jgi:ANTAR domain